MSNERDPMQNDVSKIVRLAVLLFFAYVVLHNLPRFGAMPPTAATPAKPQATTEATAKTEKAEKDCNDTIFNNFSLFAFPLMPVSSPSISVTDIKEGSGEGAVCGQRATLRYSYSTRSGNIIFSNLQSGEEDKNVLIGSGVLLKGLERGIIGMKPGGERDISMANELGFSSDKKVETLLNHEKFKFAGSTGAVTARAMLRSVTPDVPKSSMKLRRIEEQLGNHGQPIACGDKAYIKLAIWKQDGTQVFSNEKGAPLVFTVGYSQVPFGIEQGVEGMMPGGKRLVIIPPAYAAPLDADAQESLLKDLPENEILFAAVELLTEPKEAVPANIAPQQPATPPETKDK